MKHAARMGLAVALLAAYSCGSSATSPQVEPLQTPAPPGSLFPYLIAGPDSVWMSWTEPADDEHDARVQLAELRDEGWSATETISTDPTLFVNWADFPSIQFDASGNIGAHWLVRGGGPSWAYGIRFAERKAAGEWSAPAIPHGQDHPAEHGFVSLLPAGDQRFDVIWLDGREMPQDGAMELRHNVWSAGRFEKQAILDADVCTCCQTDAVRNGEEIVVAYRDHAAGEIRDISVVRFNGRKWSPPRPLTKDGWQIAACPVNGPALGASGRNLTLVWFTQAHDQPRVWALQSGDFGITFGDPIPIDGGDPIGRVDVVTFDDGSFAVAWLENVAGEAVLQLRRVDAQGKPQPALALGTTAAHRESGFPRLATDGETLWAAWTETSRPTRLRLVRVHW